MSLYTCDRARTRAYASLRAADPSDSAISFPSLSILAPTQAKSINVLGASTLVARELFCLASTVLVNVDGTRCS